MVLILSGRDIESVLTMKETIAVVEEAFRELALGIAVMPTRAGLLVSDRNGWMGAMPAYLPGLMSLATKIVTSYENNPTKYGLPTIAATIVLNDPGTGEPMAIMEGTRITAMRTGAASGVATKYLARQDSDVVGIFGAGVQARTQLEAINEVRHIRSALVYDIVKDKGRSFAQEMSKKTGIEIRSEDSVNEMISKSDIVVTASTSKTPVFNGNSLRNGTHINAVGSFRPEARELDESTILKSKLVVDSVKAALEEAGDIIVPLRSGVIQPSHIHAELGQIVLGSKPGREKEDEITVFKSVGLGIQDAATANLAYRKALKTNVGRNVDLA